MKKVFQTIESICSNKWFPIIFLLFACCFLLLMSYTTSPLYVNDSVDSSVFKSMGLAILQGKVPYLDIFDHKGPVIYFIDAFGQWIIPGRCGIFCLQIIGLTVALLYLFKTAKLFLNSTLSFVSVIIALFMYAAVIAEGNKCEEWMMIFFSISIYYSLSYFVNIQQSKHPLKYSWIYGLCFGITFLIRPNDAIAQLGGIMFGVLCYLLYKKNYKDAIYNVICFVGGFLVVLIPFICYFAYHNALYDFYYGLIGFNITYSGGIISLIRSFFSIWKLVHLLFFSMMWVMIYNTPQKRTLWILIPVIIFELLLLGTNHVSFIYYYTVFVPFYSLYIVALFATQDKSLLVVGVALLLFLPQIEKRPILKVARGAIISNIKTLKSGETAAKRFYAQTDALLSHIPENGKDSLWNYNLFWTVSSEDYKNNVCASEMLTYFSILWHKKIVQCNLITCGQNEILLEKDNLQKKHPLYVVRCIVPQMKDPRERADSVLFADYYKIAQTDTTICNVELWHLKPQDF